MDQRIVEALINVPDKSGVRRMGREAGIGPNGFIFSPLLAARGAVDDTPEWETIRDTREQIAASIAFLNLLPRIKTPTRSSYALKHRAETWAEFYISNGALLLGAHLAGVKYARESQSPNGILAIAHPKKWPEEVQSRD